MSDNGNTNTGTGSETGKAVATMGKKRNPTRWLVGYKNGDTLNDLLVISAVGAKAAVESYFSAKPNEDPSESIAVFPLRSGYDKHLRFTVVTESVTKTTITEA